MLFQIGINRADEFLQGFLWIDRIVNIIQIGNTKTNLFVVRRVVNSERDNMLSRLIRTSDFFGSPFGVIRVGGRQEQDDCRAFYIRNYFLDEILSGIDAVLIEPKRDIILLERFLGITFPSAST